MTNLTPVPRFDSHAGFCFVALDPDIVPLTDYLAGAKEVLELIASHSDSGMAIVDELQMRVFWTRWNELLGAAQG